MTAAKSLEDELTVYVYMGKDGRETGFVPWRKAALPVRYLRADVVEKRERALRSALERISAPVALNPGNHDQTLRELSRLQSIARDALDALAAADEGEEKR